MVANQISLDAKIYEEMQADLAVLRQRVTELEHAERDRKQAETALRQSEELFRTTFEQAAVGINFSTLSGRFTHFNGRWREIVGYDEEELWELTSQDITHPKDADRELELLERLLAGEIPSYSLEKRYIRPDRSHVWVHLTTSLVRSPSGEPRYVISVTQDISDRKRAEAERKQTQQQLQQKAEDLETTLRELQQTQTQLVQSEKMSSLGQLVAGVAHEINNPVNFIYGNLNYANDYIQDLLRLLQLYQQHHPNPVAEVQNVIEAIDLDFLVEDLPKLLSSMRVGAERIREIIASLRNFSRLDEAEFKTVDLHEGIDSTLMILQNRLKAKPNLAIQIVKDYGDLPKVQCYPGQLNQVFMNVLSNAIDALEEGHGTRGARHEAGEEGERGRGEDTRQEAEGKRQKDESENSSFILHPSSLRSSAPTIRIHTKAIDDRVTIRITDNGTGMPQDVQQRLFDPFFTTKAVGKGTGLGMSISYQIVTERHGGTLTCSSEVGQGTEFAIVIPVRQAGVEE